MGHNEIKILPEKKLLYWKNNKTNITIEEAKNTSEKIKNIINNKDIEIIFVDNRDIKGVWTTDVSKIWTELMNEILLKVEKTATYCDNIINKLQLDFLSKSIDGHDKIKAFTTDEENELKDFLEYEDIDFLIND